MTEAYCFKCKKKREMKNEQNIKTKIGRNAIQGKCPICGTKMFKFVS